MKLEDEDRYLEILVNLIRAGESDFEQAWATRYARTPDGLEWHDFVNVKWVLSDLRACFSRIPRDPADVDCWTYFQRIPERAHKYGWLSGSWGKHQRRARLLRSALLADTSISDLLIRAIQRKDAEDGLPS